MAAESMFVLSQGQIVFPDGKKCLKMHSQTEEFFFFLHSTAEKAKLNLWELNRIWSVIYNNSIIKWYDELIKGIEARAITIAVPP